MGQKPQPVVAVNVRQPVQQAQNNIEPQHVAAVQVRVLLVAGLALVPDDERGGQEPGDVAAEVETAIFQKYGSTGAEYAAKVGLECLVGSIALSCGMRRHCC
jgi:hypothetical protein